MKNYHYFICHYLNPSLIKTADIKWELKGLVPIFELNMKA